MPSISGNDSRHVVIDCRKNQYLCFPDVARMASGRLVCAYQEFDKHAGTRRKLLVKTSDDNGKTWSSPRLPNIFDTHCPRLATLSDNELQLLDANGQLVYASQDQGNTWSQPRRTTIRPGHAVFDRPLELDHETMLTTGHAHRGSFALPNLRQAPAEQLVYRSKNRGLSYTALSVLHFGRHLALCEASLCLLPDGRIAALMRENSMVYEPMYLSLSNDHGCSWSEPVPTPLVGHRPTLALTLAGKLLVTYRDVGPDPGIAAWMGSLDELMGQYLVHGLTPSDPIFTSQGMRIKNESGPESVARWALRPMSDPTTATAEIEAQVRVDDSSPGGAAIHMGVWWRIFPDHIIAELPATEPDNKPVRIRRKIPAGQFNTLLLSYANGRVTLRVNGHKRAEIDVDANDANTRAMLFGVRDKAKENSGDHTWKRVRQQINEPRFTRSYSWDWSFEHGLPHAPKLESVLELDNDRNAALCDMGYSGWCELDRGKFFCAYHHSNSSEPDYKQGYSAHVRGAWFNSDDFA